MQGLAKQSDKYMIEEVEQPKRIELPSAYQVGWEVCVQFGESNPIIRHCHVTKVLFTRDKVFYDLQVQIREPGETPDGYLPMCIGHTRIHSVDSAFVKDFDYGRSTVITKWNPRTLHPDTNRMVECRSSQIKTPSFFAYADFVGGGIEWFFEKGEPIKDYIHFEWTEIKLND